MAFRCPLAETAIKKCGRASSKSGIPATMHEILTTAKLFRPTEGSPYGQFMRPGPLEHLPVNFAKS